MEKYLQTMFARRKRKKGKAGRKESLRVKKACTHNRALITNEFSTFSLRQKSKKSKRKHLR